MQLAGSGEQGKVRCALQSVDQVDLQVLRILQDKGRESWAELGRAVGLSPPALCERVRRLEAQGVIDGYRAIVSPKALGFGLSAFVLLRPAMPDARFAQLALENPEILECHRVTGDVSFIARANVADVTHLESVLNRLEPLSSHIMTLVVLSTAFDRPLALEV